MARRSRRDPFRVPARTVILNDAPQAAHDAAQEQFGRFEDAYRGLEWLLARTPEVGHHVNLKTSHTVVNLYVQSSGNVHGVPTIEVAYTFDDNEVVILGLKARD